MEDNTDPEKKVLKKENIIIVVRPKTIQNDYSINENKSEIINQVEDKNINQVDNISSSNLINSDLNKKEENN